VNLLGELKVSDDRKILNKGLDALLGEQNQSQKTVKNIEIKKIKAGRFQPRSNFDKDKLNELTNSIKKQGVLSPILVRELGLSEFEVIAGERRLRASKMAGLESIPCLVDQKKDQDALISALIENLQREDLNPVEEARGLDRLKREFGLTQDEVATSTGKARSTIANSLRILSLPSSVLDMLSRGLIEKGHAKLLASLTPEEAERIAIKTSKESLSIKDLNSLVSKKTQNKKQKNKVKDTDLLNIEREMSESFGHKVEIETKNKNSGRVLINYKSLDELDNIISKIKNK
jgi:ParB family chromosome partitioning protein